MNRALLITALSAALYAFYAWADEKYLHSHPSRPLREHVMDLLVVSLVVFTSSMSYFMFEAPINSMINVVTGQPSFEAGAVPVLTGDPGF